MSIVDSRNFPVSKTIAATIVSLEPGGLRELHWHPNVSIPQSAWPPLECPHKIVTNPRPGGRMAVLSQRDSSSDGLHWQPKRTHDRLQGRRYWRIP